RGFIVLRRHQAHHPVALLIVNLPASAPLSVQLTVSPASTSLRVAVYTAPLEFSAKLPVPALVTAGASFTFVSMSCTFLAFVSPPASVAVTVISFPSSTPFRPRAS